MTVMPPAVPAVNHKEFGLGKTPAGGDAVILFGKEIPVQVAAAAVGGIGALLLFLRAKSTGSNVISAGTSSASPDTSASTAYDPDAQAIADLQTAVTDLGNEIPGTASTPTAAATSTAVSTPASPAVGVFQGSGYTLPGATAAWTSETTVGETETGQQGTFAWVQNWDQEAANLSAGIQTFFEPDPGVFAPFSGNPASVANGTTLYVESPYAVPTGATPSPTASAASPAVAPVSSPILSAAAA
jgi:hypothetical protein